MFTKHKEMMIAFKIVAKSSLLKGKSNSFLERKENTLVDTICLDNCKIVFVSVLFR